LRTSSYEDHRVTPRTVLHVLPHPGGGGETYVASLARMPDYEYSRFFLAANRNPLAAAPSLAARVPRVNFLARRFDIVHVHGEVAGFFSLPALISRPSVVTLHGLNLARRTTRLTAQLASSNLRLIVQAATQTICVSEAERGEVAEIIGNRLAGKVVVVANGVAVPTPPSTDERRTIRTELGVDDHVVAVSVGALEPPKDPLTLAEAAVSLVSGGSDTVVLVAGDGELREPVEQIARESPGAVRLLGHREDVARLMAAADLFVLSSRHEGLPYALLEAMAAGLPCVVSDYPGAVEVVGDAALLVPPGDAEGFAHAMGRLVADGSLRAALGERARRRVENRFSLEQMLAGTRQIYEEVT
jgi:glycosyltransferase involved in cell wall biosynthesis